MSTVALTVGKFVWHEQVSSDPKQAQDFYTRLFGWKTEVFKPGEADYQMISSGGQNHGGFGKAIRERPRRTGSATSTSTISTRRLRRPRTRAASSRAARSRCA